MYNLNNKCRKYTIDDFPVEDEDICKDDIQSNEKYKKLRKEYFNDVFDDKFKVLLTEKNYKELPCLLNALLENIHNSSKIIRKYKNQKNNMLQKINNKVNISNKNNNKVNKLININRVRDVNLENQNNSLNSINRQLIIYGCIIIFVILIQIYLIFFV